MKRYCTTTELCDAHAAGAPAGPCGLPPAPDDGHITKRWITRDYAVELSASTGAADYIHLTVQKRDERHGPRFSYFYGRGRKWKRGERVHLISGERRWSALPADNLGKWDDWTGEGVARRFAVAFFGGTEPAGECGCKSCKAEGWIGRFPDSARCHVCDGAGFVAAAAAIEAA